MQNKLARIYVRRVTGPRKSSVRLTLRPPLLFVILAVVTAGLGLWLDDRIERAEIAHHADQNGHQVPAPHAKSDWLRTLWSW